MRHPNTLEDLNSRYSRATTAQQMYQSALNKPHVQLPVRKYDIQPKENLQAHLEKGKDYLQSEEVISQSIEILPDKLFWYCNKNPPKNVPRSFFFNIDSVRTCEFDLNVMGYTIKQFINFLNPAHSINYIDELNPFYGIPYVFDFLGRIAVGYGIYQTVQAFRKFR